MANPADAGCTQLPHRGWLHLAVRAGSQKVLRHDGTGEEVTVGPSAELYFVATGWAYVAESDGKVTWAKDLQGKHLWKDGSGKLFVHEPKLQHGFGFKTRWRSDMEKDRILVNLPVSLDMEIIDNDKHFAVWVYSLHTLAHCGDPTVRQPPREERPDAARCTRIFVELSSVLAACDISADASWIAKKMRGKWLAMLQSHKCDNSHILVPLGAPSASETTLRAAETSVSVTALLYLLVVLRNHRREEERDIFPVLQLLLRQPWAPIPLQRQGQQVNLAVSSACKVDIASFKKSQVWKAIPANAKRSFPLAQNTAEDLADFLCKLERFPSWQWFYEAVVVCLASQLEDFILQRLPPATGEAMTNAQASVVRGDKTVQKRVAIDRLTEARASKAMRKAESRENELPSAAEASASQADRDHFCLQYFLASRKAMQKCTRIAVVDDDSTVGGRDRCRAALLNLTSGDCCWAPPKASSSLSLFLNQISTLPLSLIIVLGCMLCCCCACCCCSK